MQEKNEIITNIQNQRELFVFCYRHLYKVKVFSTSDPSTGQYIKTMKLYSTSKTKESYSLLLSWFIETSLILCVLYVVRSMKILVKEQEIDI